MSGRSIRATYDAVDTIWPDPIPALTADEAVRAGKRLWRFAMGTTFTGEVKVTSGVQS